MAFQDENAITDIEWYRQRAESVLNGVVGVNDTLLPLVNTADARRRLKTITHLLSRLHAFGQAHFDFFYNGFDTGDLVASSEFPPARVFESILDQISFDFEVILRAANQRADVASPLATRLDKADKLAWNAFQGAATRANFLQSPVQGEEWTVLTYLQKSPSVRVIPYANVALIGVPLSCLEEKRDFLAIPHEIGHVVYRRRKRAAGAPINRAFLTAASLVPKEYHLWQEEIFADTYGAWVAGPVMALDFQELALEHIPEQFLDETDKHPAPILRPLLYSKVIDQRGEHAIAEKLRQRWLRQMLDRMGTLTTTRKLTIAQDNLWQRARNETNFFVPQNGLDVTIFEALKILQGINATDWTGNGFDATLNAEAARVAQGLSIAGILDMYEQARTKLDALADDVQTADLDKGGANVPTIWNAVFQSEGFFGGGTVGDWLASRPAKIAGTTDDLNQPPNNTWIQIWLATGWTSEGPNSEPKQP